MTQLEAPPAEIVSVPTAVPAEPARGSGFRGAIGLAVIVLLAAIQIWALVSCFGAAGKPFAGFRFEPTLTVSGLGLPSWPGYRAGLVQQDRILAINGEDAQGPAQVWALVRSVPVGTPIAYKVQGESGTHVVEVATSILSPLDWALNIGPNALVAGVFYLIGVVGFLMRRENAAARVHLYFTSAMAAFSALANDYDFFAALGRYYLLSVFLLGSTAIHLGLAFPAPVDAIRRRPYLIGLVYTPAVVLGIAAAAVYRPAAAPAHPYFDAYLALMWFAGPAALLGGVVVLIGSLVARAARPPSFIAGQQAKLALFGACGAFVPMVLLWAVPTLLKLDPQVTSLVATSSQFFFLLFPAAVAYAIVRTQLFDIDLVIKRTLQYAVLVTVLGALYFTVMVVAGYGLQKVLPQGVTEATNALAAAFVAFTFSPLQSATWKFLDRVFARGGYDATQILIEFGQSARRATEPPALFDAYKTALERSFKPAYLSMSVPNLAAFSQGTGTAVLSEPLRAGAESLGVATVGSKHSDLPYTQADRDLFGAICHQLALAVENNLLISKIRGQERVTKELEIAHQVQAGLLPSELPGIPFTRLAAHNQAALEMGGDFYDIIPLDRGAFGIVLGDVSGKGVPAALLGAVCLTLFRAIAPHHASPIETLQAINEVLVRHRASRKMFVAVTYVVYHPDSGWVMGVNAGNPAPLHSGELIASKGMPLGAAKTISYCDFELIIEPGGTLVLLSDGLVDARNVEGQRFGDDRFNMLIAQHAESDPADLVRSVKAEIKEFQGARGLYDDLTIVALRRMSSAADK